LRKITAIIAVLIVGLCLQTCDRGGKKITLRTKYKPGMKLAFEQVTRGSVLVRSGDSTIHDRTSEITTEQELYVRRMVDDTVAEVVDNRIYHYKHFDKVDSSAADTIEAGPELALYITPSGRVVDFEFTSEEHQGSGTYLKNFYEQGMPVFPEGEISQGYTWTQSYKVISEGEEMTASMTYEIKSFARERGYDCVVIGYDGNLILPIEAKPQDTTQRHGVDRVTARGVIYFAYKEGFVVLERERWILDGDRYTLEKGEERALKVAIEYDIEYVLKRFKQM